MTEPVILPFRRPKSCVILQPSYIPWRGFFHQIAKADVFVFYDCVQFDRRGWRNRNHVKTPQGRTCLTVPVYARGCQQAGTALRDIEICWDTPWPRKHWATIRRAYSKAPFFRRYADLVESFYAGRPNLLADFTIETTIALAKVLGIRDTQFVRSSSLHCQGAKTDRLLDVLTKVAATHYISGPAAKDYMEQEKLSAAGITLEYMRYDYAEYPQLNAPFDPHVSILDLLFMAGPQAATYIWETAATRHAA